MQAVQDCNRVVFMMFHELVRVFYNYGSHYYKLYFGGIYFQREKAK